MRRGRLYVWWFRGQPDFNWDSMRKKSLASGRDPRYNSRAKVSSQASCVIEFSSPSMLFQTTFPTRTNQKLRRIADTKFIADVLLILSLMESSRLSFNHVRCASLDFLSLFSQTYFLLEFSVFVCFSVDWNIVEASPLFRQLFEDTKHQQTNLFLRI